MIVILPGSTMVQLSVLGIADCYYENASVEATSLDGIQFPWGFVSHRCFDYLRIAVEDNYRGEFTGFEWPLTCGDLVRIGARNLVSGNMSVRNWGVACAREISEVLQQYGIENWIDT